MGHGRMNVAPPELKQASLVKNPVSIRRDTLKIGRAVDKGSSEDHPLLVISFTFDALTSGKLTLHQMVTEVETPLSVEQSSAEDGQKEIEEAPERSTKVMEKQIKLIAREMAPANGGREDNAADAAVVLNEEVQPHSSLLHSHRIEKGLGQNYESPPLDLQCWPAEALLFDPLRPQDIPIAIRLESDVESDEEVSIQYSYLSVHSAASASKSGEGAVTAPTQWSGHIYAQKLQYGNQCFVLRDVFGVASKTEEVEVEGGNSDCVICLSEPRDTAVLPCRHMCFCSYCAGIVRLQCDRCPVCRQKVQSLLQFRKDPDGEDGGALVPKVVGASTSAEMPGSTNSAPASPSLSASAAPASPLPSVGPASSTAPLAAAL